MENAQEEKRAMTKREVIREIISWILWLAGAVVLALIVNRTVIVNAEVISGSMETTIMTGDKVLGNRLAYVFSEPKRLDVIVFRFPDNRDELPYVKRIIGMPGETVTISEGLIYINGSDVPLDESVYLHEKMNGSFGPYEVPEGSYFVLGDNRNNSIDSRAWRNKYVPKEDILGKVFMRFYPKINLIK
ncbi:MAG: signal peptidase I [Clostridiales bacterium]|jgi:signal peptidase I|nr:signal peptidase I [Clostridiales bacterium]